MEKNEPAGIKILRKKAELFLKKRGSETDPKEVR